MFINDSKQKIDKHRKIVIDFLNSNRYINNNELKPTHQSWGSILQGNFYIEKQKIKEFMKLYSDAIIEGVDNFSILEVQKEYSSIIIDIDLKVPLNDYNYNDRLYDNELILNIIKKYLLVINKYFKISKECQIFLFEKQKMTDIGEIYKDGFHIIFPDLSITKEKRHLIRHEVVKLCEEENTFEKYLDSADTIIDKAVVSSNGWFLYGSKKPEGQHYKITKSYDINLNELYNSEYDINETSIDKLIKYFSFYSSSKYSKRNGTILNDIYTESDINAEINKTGINMKNKNEINENNDVKDDFIRLLTNYVSLLSMERASSYTDWLNVGLSLYNTDSKLLYLWIEFSRKCEKKFKQGDSQGNCHKYWNTFKTQPNTNLLTYRSIFYWARYDSPKEYMLLKEEEFQKVLKKSLDNNTFTVAKAFQERYSERFICSLPSKNIWYEFIETQHKWVEMADASTLMILLSEDFANEYYKEIGKYILKITKLTGYEREECNKKIDKLNKIKDNLQDITYKKKIVEECKYLFLDQKFEEKLDNNPNLIGCNNGVYDLSAGVFRDGRYDDYLSFSTKNDYKKFSENMPYLKEFQEFMCQIQPNESVKNYLEISTALCLSGETKEEKANILTGSGSNGKSVFIDIIKEAFGDYYIPCDISLITRKRGQSNETSPEKVKMKGKRFAVFQEADEGEKINVGIFKEMTGGDIIIARDLFKGAKQMLEFKPQFKIFLTCNNLPTVQSTDDGTWRRLRVIPFNSKFTNNPIKNNEFPINTKLKHQIRFWGATVLSYFINIFNTKYKNINYLEEPNEVIISTNQYKSENDFCTDYLLNNIIQTNDINDKIGIETLYNSFVLWYKGSNNPQKLFKKNEIIKAANILFNDPINKYYVKIKFQQNSDVEINDLDK